MCKRRQVCVERDFADESETRERKFVKKTEYFFGKPPKTLAFFVKIK